MLVVSETEQLDAFREHMVGQRSGALSVTDIRYEYLINQDTEEYLHITLVLSQPPADLETPPLADVRALTRRGDAEARRLRIVPPYSVAFHFPPEPGEWDDEDDETGVGA
jgi:hypothetical protein